jgi:hypothetical protein
MRERRTAMKWIALAVAGLMTFAATASADGVTDALSAAQTAYANGNYKGASTQIQTALVGVNEKLIELLIAAMPAPPAGWTAEDPEGIDASAIGMGFFAGLMVDRTYTTPSGSTIEFTIAANSPMLSTLRMFISNPMLAQMGGQEGMTATEVCGFDAMGEFDGRAALNILAGNATLISIESQNESDRENVMTLASGTNCQGIVDIVE